MSSEKIVDRADPNFEDKMSQDNFQQFVDGAEQSTSFLSPAKVSGVGDIPDLISDETPPDSMLEIASDSDVLSASSRNELFMEGESSEGADAKLISPEGEEIKSLQSSVDLSGTDAPVSAKIKIFEMANLINNNISVQKFSNMGQTDMGGEEISEPEEKGCAVPVNESEFHEISQAMAKDMAIPGTSESGAVNAPNASSSNSEVGVSPKKKAKPTTDDNSTPSPDHEDCLICCNEYSSFNLSPFLWKELKCSHRLCQACYKTIETTRTTMSGTRHTFVKCPFCQGTTGTQIGDCPNGEMTIANVSYPCSGYRVQQSIQIHYSVSSRQYRLSRTAYLPNNEEGKEVLALLKTAWDRRLCFTIGTSMTTGEENVLVWNIHHKTSPDGGVEVYGYPDPGYFGRVKSELKAYGIE